MEACQDFRAMRLAFLALAAILIGFAALAVGWGVWLLTTPDEQGARHVVGGLTLAVGAVSGLLGIASAVAGRRESKARLLG